MPDHFHLLLTVDTGITLERAVQFIKGGFSFRAGREFGIGSPIWQKGFSDRRIWGFDDFERIRNYIHKNPVKQPLKPSSLRDVLRYGWLRLYPDTERPPPTKGSCQAMPSRRAACESN